jgi:predicted fused transcriptional regulator/phosphomethylpyrimidine kinase/diadenosine tetraphosphate (Ap4A) HIT family hydrolase
MEIENLEKAIKILQNCPEFNEFIPEVRSNIVMAIENAKNINDVAGIPGRITSVHGKPKVFMKPEFGVSSHMARLVLSIMKFDPSKRSAINIIYNSKIIEICQKLGLKISYYDRKEEPESVKMIEGGTIPWGVEAAIKRIGDVPDIIYHKGAWGKEPSIALIGTNAVEVVKMVVCIAKLYQNIDDYKVIFPSTSKKENNLNPEIPCIFCEMAKKGSSASKNVLFNDGKTMVVLNKFPYTKGHLLAIPVKHYTDFKKIDADNINNLFKTVQRSLKLIEEVINPDGINIGINLGEVAGQRISHIHVHLVPRFKLESGFMGTIANTRIINENLNKTKEEYLDKIDLMNL